MCSVAFASAVGCGVMSSAVMTSRLSTRLHFHVTLLHHALHLARLAQARFKFEVGHMRREA